MQSREGISKLCLVRMGFFLAVVAWPAAAGAEEFRIVNRVYSGQSKQPASESLTLFRAGIVYDYLSKPARVAVFDQAHKKFILLDLDRKVKTEAPTDRVMKFADDLHDFAAKNGNSGARFQADPKFEITTNDDTHEISFGSPQMTYSVTMLKSPNPEAAQQYREFSDWYGRLNAMIGASASPFPRLLVNAELAKRNVVPEQVHLTIGRGVSLRSEHDVAWKLLPKDHDKISATGNDLVTFEMVSLKEFQKLESASK